MIDADRLFRLLWSQPLGRVFVCNLLDGVKLRTLQGTEAAALVQESLTLASGYSPDFLDYISAAANVASLDLKSSIKPARLPKWIATSFPAKYLVPTLTATSDTTLNDLAREINAFYEPSTPSSDLDVIENRLHDILSGSTRTQDYGLLRIHIPGDVFGSRKYGWVSSFGMGDAESRPWKPRHEWIQRADEMRDVLGLVHLGCSAALPSYWERELLACFVVPSSAVPASCVFARPNCCDAAGGTRFKAAFGDLRRKAYEWGRTADLAKIQGSRPRFGGRELVVENFTPRRAVYFTILGSLRVPRGDYLGEEDKSFSDTVVRGRDPATLQNRFIDILS